MGKKYKKCPEKEMQIKLDSLTYKKRNVTKIKFVKIKMFENIYIVRNQKPSHILQVQVPTGTAPTRVKFQHLPKLQTCISFDSVILLEIYPTVSF